MKSEKGAMMMIMSLVALLSISVGIYVYNSATSTINSASASLGQQEKNMYNSLIETYVGDSVSGTQVKSLISTIISSNTQYIGENDKFISIEMDGENSLSEACEEANPYDYGENTSENVKNATTQMSALKNKIDTSKKYTVEATYDDGLIVKVEISEK